MSNMKISMTILWLLIILVCFCSCLIGCLYIVQSNCCHGVIYIPTNGACNSNVPYACIAKQWWVGVFIICQLVNSSRRKYTVQEWNTWNGAVGGG